MASAPHSYSIATVVRRLFDARVRGRWLTRLLSPRLIHQDTTLTWRNRYPALFAAVRDQLGRDGAHLILSFGCAAGDEVLTLRDYFPRARIVGAEINPAELAACRRLDVDDGIAFVRSTPAEIAARGPFDAIFCMAVLQRRPDAVARTGLTDIARLYPFARFDDAIALLTAQLRPGGLLVVEHSQYRIEDSAAASLLDPVAGVGDWTAKGPRFGRDGQLIRPQPAVSRVFRRRGSVVKHDTTA